MPLRVGLFTHSTNPRGGVVHCLELAEALGDRGHDVTVHAPDVDGRGFFRPPRRARHELIPAASVHGGLAALVRQRVAEYVAHLGGRSRDVDVHHAHDGISGNALADLGVPFVRTVHHLDDFADPWVAAAQDRSITAAERLLVVSELWRDVIGRRYGRDATLVPVGVDLHRFRPGPRDDRWRERWVGRRSPVFLAVGGVEGRKNTVRLARAFDRVRRSLPDAALLVVGGATLLDHSAEQRAFEVLDRTGVTVTGPLSDDEMVTAYRSADVLAFPSLVEGFGLAVPEAWATGLPVVTSAIRPFTEYVGPGEAVLVDPLDVDAIAAGLFRAIENAAGLRRAGLAAAGRFDWPAAAAAHEAAYPSPVPDRG